MDPVLEEQPTAELVQTGETEVENAFKFFAQAVQISEDLELLGTNEEDTHFVLRNHKLAEGIDGSFVDVSIKEVIELVKNSIDGVQVINAVLGKRSDIVLNGISRIVGYYSRVQHWNKSKVGELRDRTKGIYWTERYTDSNNEARQKTIDNL